uniref:RING-type domain-containing protein n=1 Tax=Spongospora subterranea TaxID=70186 RepID=A0A0H5REG7_9EUKA|eukprot:CRZ12398.1 hypothetical protein [Spongospora subterranea]
MDLCPICHERPDPPSSPSTCSHIMCTDCLLEWANVTNLCPLCKVRFEWIRTGPDCFIHVRHRDQHVSFATSTESGQRYDEDDSDNESDTVDSEAARAPYRWQMATFTASPAIALTRESFSIRRVSSPPRVVDESEITTATLIGNTAAPVSGRRRSSRIRERSSRFSNGDSERSDGNDSNPDQVDDGASIPVRRRVVFRPYSRFHGQDIRLILPFIVNSNDIQSSDDSIPN